MAIWYEVEHSESGIYNFMNCNWCFHDFKIERVCYLPDDYTAEIFLRYDELDGSILLRFLNVQSMNITLQVESGYMSDMMGSVLILLENGQFLWSDDDSWGEQSIHHIDELKKKSSWIQAERIIWAMTDDQGAPTELSLDKMDQTWQVYGKTECHHFVLTPFKELE